MTSPVLTQLRRHPVIWGSVISGLLIFAGAVTAALINHNSGPGPVPDPTTPPPIIASTTAPAVTGQILTPDGATPVKRCTTVTGAVSNPDPAAGAYWLVIQTTNGDFFIIGRLHPDPSGHWQQQATIGGTSNVGSKTYVLLLVHTDDATTALFAGQAAGKPLPPSLITPARSLAQVRVHRDPVLNC